MNVKSILGLVCVFVLALPVVASAEIYKWRDKNGVMRYTDTPPPANVKSDTLSKTGATKKYQSAPSPAPTSIEPQTTNAEQSSAGKIEVVNPEEIAEMDAAQARARNAEIEKNNKLEKEAEQRRNAENCKAAKSNYAAFSKGGRIYKTTEQGQKVYFDDAGLKAGKEKAQAEIRKYCK